MKIVMKYGAEVEKNIFLVSKVVFAERGVGGNPFNDCLLCQLSLIIGADGLSGSRSFLLPLSLWQKSVRCNFCKNY
jgi:hypothetical protein